MTAQISRILGAIVVMAVGIPAWAQQEPAMPVSQQNALVQKYCAVCHSHAKMMGGLSLEGFDASHADPSVAGMMVNKLNGGAMGAAGIPIPDSSVINALTAALSAEAADAASATGGWTFRAFNDPVSKAPLVTATILRDLPSATGPVESSAYQLPVTCQKNSDLAKGGNAGDAADMRITAYKKGSGGPAQESFPFTFEVDGTSQNSVLQLAEPNSGAAIPVSALP